MTHVVLSSRALCAVEDVVRLVPGYESAGDPATEDILVSLINAESTAAHNRYGREFVTIAGATTRKFDVTDDIQSSRVLPVGDMTTVTTVTIKDINGTTLETVAAADRVSLPRVRQEWEPITELWFPATTNAASNLAVGNVVEVVGVWGFPVIPEDLQTSVAKLVLIRYLADASSAGTSLADALNQQGFDSGSAFASAREVMRDYQRTRFA